MGRKEEKVSESVATIILLAPAILGGIAGVGYLVVLVWVILTDVMDWTSARDWFVLIFISSAVTVWIWAFVALMFTKGGRP